MSRNLSEPLTKKPAKKRTALLFASFLGVLLIAVLVLVGMAYAMLTSGEKQAYQSPGSASGAASDVAVMSPRGASDTIPAMAAASGAAGGGQNTAVEQLDPTQALPATAPASPDLPGKPLDPTNRNAPNDLDNLF